ncbi:MAG: DNA-protecting protein DprA [Chitinophagaceae bacterium]|nr:DNA-protecting protein DprA [Chitinophagaceae bacterium]
MNTHPENDHEELYHQLALSYVNGIGGKMGRMLIEKFGSATNVFKVPLKELKNTDGIGEIKAKAFKDSEVFAYAEKEMAFLMQHDVKVLCLAGTYPQRLTGCSDAPLLMFYKGTAGLEAKKIVAVVGTRKNTDYGHKLCEDLIEGLQSLEGLLVVSGLALGIDSIAHKKCVQLGIPTVGVLGHGLDTIYPYSNKTLAAQMIENGGLLSEFPSGTIPDRTNFPMRNRIVAGMSDVTVVVESNATGGALITATLAAGYHREVAAFPGRVNDTRSAGCNELIRTNMAAMITKADDLVELMNWDKDRKPRAVQKQLFLNLSADEQKIMDLLQTKDNVHADELFHHSGLASTMLAATLLQLEMQGLIKALPGKFYRTN